ncbi:MAG TPA: hypothetical protein VJJ83_04770, partial [Candidatus Babeliales bacterium]|nr:hypothetical protein [Candidatus Babeliales bacterium]
RELVLYSDWTALLMAADVGGAENIAALLRAGANANDRLTMTINGQSHPHLTALMLATRSYNSASVTRLLMAGADVNAQATVQLPNETVITGVTALLLAVQYYQAEITQQLIAAGGRIISAQRVQQLTVAQRAFLNEQNAVLTTREQALIAAIRAGDMARVSAASDPSVILRNRTATLSQALFYALDHSSETASALITLLLQRGADINFGRAKAQVADAASVSPSTTTPPAAAAVDATVTSPVVLRPLDVAILQNRTELVAFLLAHGADPLQIAEITQQRLAAFTSVPRLPLAAHRAARMAELATDPAIASIEQRWAQVPAVAKLTAAAQSSAIAEKREKYIDQAFAIAQLMAEATMAHTGPSAAFAAMQAPGKQ